MMTILFVQNWTIYNILILDDQSDSNGDGFLITASNTKKAAFLQQE
jgi:hypothetical protein